MTHGAIMATKRTIPAMDQRARPRRRQSAYGRQTSSGSAMATGPLVRTPRAIEAQATAVQRRVGVRPAEVADSMANQNATIERTMKNVSALSKITVRENARLSGMAIVMVAA